MFFLLTLDALKRKMMSIKKKTRFNVTISDSAHNREGNRAHKTPIHQVSLVVSFTK